jgi:hypothetical protein
MTELVNLFRTRPHRVGKRVLRRPQHATAACPLAGDQPLGLYPDGLPLALRGHELWL